MRSDAEFYPRDHDWHPPALAPTYKSSIYRSPKHSLIRIENTASELTGPVFGQNDVNPIDSDLLENYSHSGAPIGPRILVHGQVLDENARPVAGTMVEIWQANSGGRYRHKVDTYLAPIDPNFGGCGRTITDENGYYSFRTVMPGAYPWPNGPNTWRPAHIHVSLFGSGFAQRLITQLYFEGDPLIGKCAIVNSIPDPQAVERLIARLDMDRNILFDMIAYKFDIVLRGKRSTMFENRPEGN